MGTFGLEKFKVQSSRQRVRGGEMTTRFGWLIPPPPNPLPPGEGELKVLDRDSTDKILR
jgi:hypothetical protein